MSRQHEPIRAQSSERAEIAKLYSLLCTFDAACCGLIGPRGEHVTLTETTFELLVQIVEILQRGDAVTLVPVHQELTTQHAADLLNVSRQYLIRLLDEGKIPYQKTGTHRRLRVDHVLAYKIERDRDRRAALDELAEASEELGGYEEFK